MRRRAHNADDLTGTHSVYTRWQGYEVMFHVSTLLPLTPGSGPQVHGACRGRAGGGDAAPIADGCMPAALGPGARQLERKRHIGNDIVVIIFQEGDTPVQIRSFESKQNHVFVFVQPTPRGYRYGGAA